MLSATHIVALGKCLYAKALPLCDGDLNAAYLFTHQSLMRLMARRGLGGQANARFQVAREPDGRAELSQLR